MAKGQGLTLKALLQLETKAFTQGINKVKRQLSGLANAFKSAFALGSIAAFGKQVVNVSKDFEDSIARVRAITNASQKDFENMRKEAAKMGETTRYTASEAAGALENLTRNGMTASQATKALSGVMQLAQANAIDLARSADIVTNVLNMFGLSVAEVGRVNDVLSSTAANAATDIDNLYEALVNASPAAKTLGFSVEETSAAIGALAQRGVKGSDAGTQLRMALTKMADPKIIAKMQAMGVAIDEESMKSEGLLGTINRLRKAELSLTDLVGIFSQKGAVGMQQLINSYDDFNRLLEVTKNSAGTTARMFEEGVGTTRKEIDTLRSMYEGLLISIGDKTSGVVNSAVRGLQNLINNFKSVGGVIFNIASVVLPLLVRKVMVLGRTAGTTLAAIKTGVAGITAAMGGWVTILVTLVTWVGTALYGAWARVNQPLKDAKKHFDEIETETSKLKKEAGELIDRLGPDTDQATLAGVVKRLTELFPDFANEINNAAKIAAKTENWETLRDILTDIVELQARVMENEARQEIIDATAAKVGNQLYNIATNPNSQYRQVNNPRNQVNYRGESAEWIASVVRHLRNVDNLPEEKVIKILSNLTRTLSQKNKDAGTRYGEAYQLLSPYGVKMEGDILQHFAYFLEKELKGGFNVIRDESTKIYQNDSTSIADGVNGLRKQVEDLTKSVEEKKTTQNEANELLSNAAASIKANKNFNKLSEEDKKYVDSVLKEHSVPTKKPGGGGGGPEPTAKTTADLIKETLTGYTKSAKELKNQLDAGALSQKEYEDAIKRLVSETFKAITAFDNYTDELKNLPQELQDTATAIGKSFAENVAEGVKAQTDKEIEKLKKYVAEEASGNIPKSKDPGDNEVPKGQTFSKAQRDEFNARMENANKYADSLQDMIDELQEAIDNGDFDLIKESALKRMQELKDKLALAKNEATSFKDLLEFSEAQEQITDMQEQLENMAISGVEDIARGISQVSDALADILELFDEDIRDSDFFKSIKDTMTVFDSFLSIFSAIKTAVEAWGAVTKMTAAIQKKAAVEEVAANTAVAASEGTKAAAAAGAAAAGAASSVAGTPIVGPILAVAAVGAVVAAIIAAMSKFATGGVISGNPTGDKHFVRVNGGEAILTKAQQSSLYNLIEKGGVNGGQVTFKLRGTDLIGSIENTKARMRG